MKYLLKSIRFDVYNINGNNKRKIAFSIFTSRPIFKCEYYYDGKLLYNENTIQYMHDLQLISFLNSLNSKINR